jgi:hypothetical protein
MKVKLKNSIQHLIKEDGEFSCLKSELVYFVVGVFMKDNKLFYYLDVDNVYPIAYYAGHFEIVDNKISKHWVFNYLDGDFQLMFEDWIKIPNCINFFIDGDVEEDDKFYELRQYNYYKRLLEQEFKMKF